MQGTKQRPNSRAFTRTELLLVIAMCCVLLPLLTVASQRSEEDVRRVQCRSNLKQMGVWLTAYAGDNNGKLPGNFAGGWAWDIHRSVINSASVYGVPVDSFFCPSGPSEGTWIHYNYASHFAVGVYLFPMSEWIYIASNVNYTIEPQPITVGDVTITPKASERELAADPTISIGADRTTANFVEVWGGSLSPHRAPHLDGTVPAGGNVLFLDGHVEWRKFSEMKVRTRTGSPAFWY